MNLFIQGMRRSGTTILYDALLEDPELHCFYEPFREEKVTVGGGSGARDVDAFAETRALRHRFREQSFPQLEIEQFNWGGPRAPSLELETELPEHCLAFLRHLLDLAPQVAVKETRMYCKVPVLAELDAGAAFVHVVRDPRAVTASILLGRGQRRARRLGTPDAFFGDRKQRKLWSSYEISERLLERPEYSHVMDPENFLRVLIVWKLSFEQARRDGLRHFGERYVLLRNEDLRADPGSTVEALYRVLGRPVPEGVAAWAQRNVRPPGELFAADDPRWAEAFERLGMEEALREAGYGELIAAPSARHLS